MSAPRAHQQIRSIILQNSAVPPAHAQRVFLLDYYLQDFVLKRKIPTYTESAQKSAHAPFFKLAQMSQVLFLISNPFCSIVVS